MLYLVESTQEDSNSIIHEFHRNSDGTKTIKKIESFKSYFYIDEKAPIEKWEGIIRTKKGFTSIDSTSVKKVVVQKSTLVRPIKEKIEELGFKSWEADIPFHNRYTIDLPEVKDDAKLKIGFIDIETDMETIAPHIDLADKTICCLTLSINKNRIAWGCGPKPLGDRYFPKESDMLKDFIAHIKKESVDMLVAWNINDFDMRYFINRCKRLDIDYKRLSPLRDVADREYGSRHYIKIKGIVVFDLLEAYKLWRKYGNLPLLRSYSLDYVARTVLNKNKIPLDKPTGWYWRNNTEKLIEYNKWDVELLELIDDRCKVIDFFNELRVKCRCQFDDVYRTTALIDGYLINRLNKEYILPTAIKNKEDKFEGAFVVKPKKGLYNNILCEDVKGMYPTIIKTFNISYETLGGNDIILPTGQTFSKKPGIIPLYLDELATERARFKKLLSEAKTKVEEELWHQRQFGTKVLSNSFYGYLGYIGSRLYKREVAEAVTGMAKHIILNIIKWIEENGNKVIYGDTDSCYVLANKKEKHQIILEGLEIRDMINKKLKEFGISISGTSYLEIEFEKVLKTVLFTEAKKRYAYKLLWDEKNNFDVKDELVVQGFDSKRSDSNIVSRIVQKEVIRLIIEGIPKDKIITYVRYMNAKMRERKFLDEEIGIPKGITKNLNVYDPPGPIIKGAVYSNKHFGTQFGRGSKPKFVWINYVKGFPSTVLMHINGKNKTYIKEYKIESIVYDTKIPEQVEINWDRMTDATFKKKLENIFDAVGWKWQSLNTMGLSSFMR